jgi:uncharacterized protein YecE (DUF72 family)
VIHIGTSGWQYTDWRGTFYPADLPLASWLRTYAMTFSTVEVNNSFYRLPERSTFERWKEETPVGFVMAVKVSRFLTHVKRLKDPAEPIERLLDRVVGLGPSRGPLLLQLPPTLARDDARLRETLKAIGTRANVAVEFRHPSWAHDDVYKVLDSFGAAHVLADRPGARVPPIVTGGWSYIRFHRGTKAQWGYASTKLARWADLIAELPSHDTYIYFNNDPGAAAPRDALRLADMLRARGGDVAPVPHGTRAQQSGHVFETNDVGRGNERGATSTSNSDSHPSPSRRR